MASAKKGRKRRRSISRAVVLLTPDMDAARDEGPRLIPLSDKNLSSTESSFRVTKESPETNSYVALADHALSLWQETTDRKQKEKSPSQEETHDEDAEEGLELLG